MRKGLEILHGHCPHVPTLCPDIITYDESSHCVGTYGLYGLYESLLVNLSDIKVVVGNVCHLLLAQEIKLE